MMPVVSVYHVSCCGTLVSGASQGSKDRYYLGPDGKVLRSRNEAVAKASDMAKLQLLVDAAEEVLAGRVSTDTSAHCTLYCIEWSDTLTSVQLVASYNLRTLAVVKHQLRALL